MVDLDEMIQCTYQNFIYNSEEAQITDAVIVAKFQEQSARHFQNIFQSNSIVIHDISYIVNNRPSLDLSHHKFSEDSILPFERYQLVKIDEISFCIILPLFYIN